MNPNKSTQTPVLFFVWIVIACLGRIVPHPFNATPLMSLSIIAGSRFTRWMAVLMVVIAMLISDVLVSMVYGYPPFGVWTWFTYSGFVGVVLISPYLCRQFTMNNLLIATLFNGLFFWLWTNFGTWLISGMYPKTLEGLTVCYLAGLPFLRHALLGNLIWMVVIAGLLKLALLSFPRRVSPQRRRGRESRINK